MLRGVYLPRAADAGAAAMATYGIPLLVLATTNSSALTGAAFTLEWIPRLAAFTVAGQLVDRLGASAVFRAATAARAVVALAAAVVLPTQGGPIATTVVMVLAASTGVLSEVSYIAAETTGGIASQDAGERAHRVQGVLLGCDQVAGLMGPALAGLFLQKFAATGMLIAIAGLSAAAGALAPCPHHPRPATARARSNGVLRGLRVGLCTLRSLPALGWLVAGLALSNLASGTLQAAAPAIVVTQLGHSTADVGLIWSAAAAAALGTVAGCRLAISRFGLWPVIAACAAVASSACLAVSLTHTYTGYLVLIALLTAGEAGMTVVLRTLRSHLIPKDVFGATLSLTILLLLLPFPLAGILVAAVPPPELAHVVTGCAVAQALGLLVTVTRLRTNPALRTSTSS
ncbi:MFS transporter [Actinacidiphila sp. bgisy144]|uniref:MFS transporter n=1 Tax=Actinacidiphila sp. bgisy144 TaxID=3413791 RepID=UPI003EC0CD2B